MVNTWKFINPMSVIIKEMVVGNDLLIVVSWKNIWKCILPMKIMGFNDLWVIDLN